jgi:hypothetical protein
MFSNARGQAADALADFLLEVGYSNTDGFYNTEKRFKAIRLIDGLS